MYSVVMMAALSTGGGVETVGWTFNGCSGCGGCSGCYGYTAGWGCNGGCNGCRGGCTGAFLGATHSRWGCHGCAGSCYGAGYAVHHGGCHGASYGCTGCFGSTPAVTPYRVLEHRSAKPEELKPKPTPEPGGKPNTLAPNRARILVELPADARLYIDDHLTTGTSDVRSFTTPELAAAQEYFYDVLAELVRDGEVVARASERITFRPGEEKRLILREVAFRPVEIKATAKR